MPAGPQAAYDRVVTLLDGYAMGAASQGYTTLRESDYQFELIEQPSSDIHRKFQVLYDGAESFPGTGGQYAGSTLDEYVQIRVHVAYFLGGGDYAESASASAADIKGTDRLAADDLNRVRQRIQHPANYDGANTGIANVLWRGTRKLAARPGSSMALYEVSFSVHVRHAVIS